MNGITKKENTGGGPDFVELWMEIKSSVVEYLRYSSDYINIKYIVILEIFISEMEI